VGDEVDISTPIPKSWGSDKLSDFCNRCHHNTVATHVNAPDAYRKLAEVSAIHAIMSSLSSREQEGLKDTLMKLRRKSLEELRMRQPLPYP